MRIRVEPAEIELSIDVGGEARPGDVEVIDRDRDEPLTSVRVELLDVGVHVRAPSWSSGLPDLTLLWVGDTGRLFVGAKRTSCVVNLAARTVEHRFEHCLFWSFSRAIRPGWILETGELDCLFRALDGAIVAQVPVDPPYEMAADDDGLRFDSIVHGRTFLRFPDR